MSKILPKYWRSTLEDIEKTVKNVKTGKVDEFLSSGKRKIYKIYYGEKNRFNRTANYSSAAGARDIRCYADKTAKGYRPTAFFVGGIHGFEFEGTVALLNLINIIETGKDYTGNSYPILAEIVQSINLCIIPCANPDGRSRVPFLTADGISLEDFRYYAQGTWANGELCNWPQCKTLHPMKGEKAGKLGAYYNDDGINMMHDLFPFPKAEETKLLFNTVDELVPECTVLLHGGVNNNPTILLPEAVHSSYRKKAETLSLNIKSRAKKENLDFDVQSSENDGIVGMLPNYNLTSALTNTCGEVCITYESNQGLDGAGVRLSLDEVYLHHIIMFEEVYKFVK